MRLLLSLAIVALLAGCSTVSTVRDAWNWDPTLPTERSRIVPSLGQSTALIRRLADLQTQRTEIRSRISAEPDIRARQRLYEELHIVGLQLSPMERQLTAATAR